MEKEKKACKKHGLVIHYHAYDKGYWRWRCTKCNQEKVKEYRRKKKLWAIDYLGGKCKICGYDKCASALEFHHRNPEEKEFSISKYQNSTYERLKKELDKCDLLCANCHREQHVEDDELG